jgi:hypothetical protein
LTAWCVECDQTISLGEKKSLITLVIDEWHVRKLAGDLDAIKDADHRQVEWEMSRQKAGV